MSLPMSRQILGGGELFTVIDEDGELFHQSFLLKSSEQSSQSLILCTQIHISVPK